MTLSRILLTLTIIMPAVISAQTRTEKYFTTHYYFHEYCDSASAKYIVYHIYDDSLSKSGIIRITDFDGKIFTEDEYSVIPELNRDGYSKEFHEDGTTRYHANYKNNKLHGELTSFYISGQLKRKDIYEIGEFVSGNCYTSSGMDTTYYDYRIAPVFIGGEEARIRYLINNIKYPVYARRNGISGIVKVKFDVEKDGTISNVGILESVHPALDKESLRVIRKMPSWNPGIIDGEKVRVQINMPIKFTIAEPVW
jgi:protein TonB